MVIYLKSLRVRPVLRPSTVHYMNEASVTGLRPTLELLSYVQDPVGAFFGDRLTIYGLVVFLEILACLSPSEETGIVHSAIPYLRTVPRHVLRVAYLLSSAGICGP